MTTFAMPITLDRNEEWTGGHAGHGDLVDRDLSRSQTFTVAAGDLLDVSVVIPADPFAAPYGVDSLLATRLSRLLVTFSVAGEAASVTFDSSRTQVEAPVAGYAGGTFRPAATLWTEARLAGPIGPPALVTPVPTLVDVATGFLRFPFPGAVTVAASALLRRYQDVAEVVARQSASTAAMLAERASIAAQRAAQAH